MPVLGGRLNSKRDKRKVTNAKGKIKEQGIDVIPPNGAGECLLLCGQNTTKYGNSDPKKIKNKTNYVLER